MANTKKYLNLPRTKEVDGVVYPYISYSQYSSFNETSDEFRYQMILQYIFGIKIPSRFQDFADFGTAVGEYIETQGKKRSDMLSEEDCQIIDKEIKDFSKDSEYERQVWIDRGTYFILGFTDRFDPLGISDDGPECNVEDFKTGNIAKKKSFYASGKYGQTTLYGYAEEEKGIKVNESFVTMFDRKGNPMSDTNPTELHLTGVIEKIPTPYSTERAETLLKDIDQTAIRLASLKTTHDKLKELTIQM